MKTLIPSISSLTTLLVIFVSTSIHAAPFGESVDIKYSQTLWKNMTEANFVGKNAHLSKIYTGQHPHGAFLDTIEGTLKVGSNTGHIIVKRNYGGEGISASNVANDPNKYLMAVTVMYKRSGFDRDNQDWFWVKYKKNGDLHTNPKGMQLAGKIAKGMPAGCIACHAAAPGGDMVFLHDKLGR